MAYPNSKAFREVKKKLVEGGALNFRDVGDVFGPDFWELVLYAFLDANDAARAIQLASQRLRGGEVVDE